MTAQEKLVEILKKKGVGPEGSKSLDSNKLIEVEKLFLHPGTSIITRATLLTALLTLKPTEIEKEWITKIKNKPHLYLPESLLAFFEVSPENKFQAIINKIIRLEDLNVDEANYAIAQVFNDDTQAYLVAAFLEAMRLKRETYLENRTFYNYFKNNCLRKITDLPIVVDLCDSYDGLARHHNYGVFTASLLASLGVPTILHGLDAVAPKNGVTHHQILKAAGKDTLLGLDESQQKLENKEIGWAYVDQAVYFPQLFNLKTLREEMVKRPFLATFEKLLQPIRSKNGNFIVTAYTHKHYRMEVVKLLQDIGDCQQALHFKGIEATSQPNPSRDFPYIHLTPNEYHELDIHPEEYKITSTSPKLFKEGIKANEILDEGVNALNGEQNGASAQIRFQAALILKHLGWHNDKIILSIDNAINTGLAKQHWEKG